VNISYLKESALPYTMAATLRYYNVCTYSWVQHLQQ